jgi:hypothetical protein
VVLKSEQFVGSRPNDTATSTAKYTAIWQSPNPHERDWIEEVFGPLIDRHVTDGKHELVLDDCILLDAFVYSYDVAYYERFRGKNAFLVHFLDENFEGRYEAIYRNFRGVFRCHWADVFNPKYVMKLPIGYCSGMSRAGRRIASATERKYLWSFVGQVAKSSRPDMAKALSGVEPHFLFSTDDVSGFVFLNPVGGKSRRLPATDSSQILFQSVFSPCPMGNVQVESFRLYESLEAGSIPIVEKRWTLDYFRLLLGEHPIPTVRSWAEARALIKRMAADPDGLNALQERCLSWWESYKRAYREQVGEFIHQRAGDAVPPHEPIMTRKYSLPGWRVIELLRHHDAHAFARRIHRQMSRILRKGTLRVAHRPGVKLD